MCSSLPGLLIGRTAVHSGKDPAFVAYDQFLSTGILQPLSRGEVRCGSFATDPIRSGLGLTARRRAASPVRGSRRVAVRSVLSPVPAPDLRCYRAQSECPCGHCDPPTIHAFQALAEIPRGVPSFPDRPRPRATARRSCEFGRPAAHAPHAAMPPRRQTPPAISVVQCPHAPPVRG